MALSLPGERSIAADSSARPMAAFARWIVKAQTARTRRNALKALLELDDVRLSDLGISRADIADAIVAPIRGASVLNAARTRNARR